MRSRERFLGVMRYGDFDHVPFIEGMGPWPETTERWKGEGFDPQNPPDFGFEHWEIPTRWFFPNPPFEHRVVEQDETTVLYVNEEGILMRERKDHPRSSMPQFVRFPVQTREDFRRFWAERMQPDLSARIGPDWKEQLRAHRGRDYVLGVISDRWGGFFGPLRNLVGVQRLCELFYDDPGFVEEMMDAVAEFIIAVMDQVLDQTSIEIYGFWEDMAYKTGPLIGPEMARRFMLPRYRTVVQFLRSRGVEFVMLDSDGHVNELIPIWLEAGIDTLYPFEVQAGMDVVEVRRRFGKHLRLWYGIDKRALARGREAIDAELERVEPLLREGGYVPGTDHSIPPDVSFESYCYYRERLRETIHRAGRSR